MENLPIIYSHGFGTRSDARGMFSDIQNLFPKRSHIQFDYNQIIDDKTLRVVPLTEQVATLRNVISGQHLGTYGADLICHSQGGVVAALCDPTVIRRAIFIAPPPSFDINRFLERSKTRPGAIVNIDSDSIMPRSDGSTTIVPATYWESIRNVAPIPAYNAFAQHTELIIIAGNQDNVFPVNEFPNLDPSIRLIRIDGNHDFYGESRDGLLQLIKDLL